jgi:hypothetical protein
MVSPQMGMFIATALVSDEKIITKTDKSCKKQVLNGFTTNWDIDCNSACI